MNRKIAIAAVAGLTLVLVGSAALLSWKTGYISAGGEPHAEKVEEKLADHSAPPRDGVSSVRKLFKYQDMVAKGDRDAIASQNDSIDAIAREFNSYERSDWSDHKNVHAMMAYVLSGGKTEVVERFLSMQVASKEQEDLAKGVLSFALRRPKTAIKQIGDIDTRALDRPLVGVMALALASLHAAENNARSVALFDEARLHAPDTAVEEAAIRREVPMLLKAGETDRANVLLSRYLRVFGQSPFAPRFYGEAADSLMALDETKALHAVTDLGTSVSEVPQNQKSPLFLRIARAALIAGKVLAAKNAANLVIAMSDEGSPETRRAKLYAAAAIAATEKAESVLPDLEALGDDGFDDDEKSIRSAATTIARGIVQAGASEIVTERTPQNSEDAFHKPGLPTEAGVTDMVRKADVALKEADRLINSVKQ